MKTIVFVFLLTTFLSGHGQCCPLAELRQPEDARGAIDKEQLAHTVGLAYDLAASIYEMATREGLLPSGYHYFRLQTQRFQLNNNGGLALEMGPFFPRAIWTPLGRLVLIELDKGFIFAGNKVHRKLMEQVFELIEISQEPIFSRGESQALGLKPLTKVYKISRLSEKKLVRPELASFDDYLPPAAVKSLFEEIIPRISPL